MKRWKPTSLQWRLTWSLLAVTGLVWALALVLMWRLTRHELSELLDAHLAQTAAVLAVQTENDPEEDFTTAPVLHQYQSRVAFQIWHDNELIARSAQAPQAPLAPIGAGAHAGISDQLREGIGWRVFSAQGREADVWVLVAEEKSARDAILNAGLRSAIAPVLLALPLLVFFIGWVVSHALAPLRQLGQSVAQRDPQALQPLPQAMAATEVAPLVLALNRLFEQVAQHIEGERRFTADAAHELRTPIAAIRMQAQVALGAQTDADRTMALEAVLQGCDRATRLVSQLLQLARLDAARLEEAHGQTPSAAYGVVDGVVDGPAERCDAVAITRETLAALGTQAMDKQQTLGLQAPASLFVPMPAGLLAVLVGNLVDNAQRYSPVGAHIEVQWESTPVPCLRVQDSGPGMAQADMERLGQRFFRVLGSEVDGSGLGWSIVQRLAQRYALQVQLGRSQRWGGLQVQVRWGG